MLSGLPAPLQINFRLFSHASVSLHCKLMFHIEPIDTTDAYVTAPPAARLHHVSRSFCQQGSTRRQHVDVVVADCVCGVGTPPDLLFLDCICDNVTLGVIMLELRERVLPELEIEIMSYTTR